MFIYNVALFWTTAQNLFAQNMKIRLTEISRNYKKLWGIVGNRVRFISLTPCEKTFETVRNKLTTFVLIDFK